MNAAPLLTSLETRRLVSVLCKLGDRSGARFGAKATNTCLGRSWTRWGREQPPSTVCVCFIFPRAPSISSGVRPPKPTPSTERHGGGWSPRVSFFSEVKVLAVRILFIAPVNCVIRCTNIVLNTRAVHVRHAHAGSKQLVSVRYSVAEPVAEPADTYSVSQF